VTLPPVLLYERPAVVLLLEGALVYWSLAIDEHSGLEDLHGSGRRSVIPYVLRRIEFIAQAFLAWAFPFFDRESIFDPPEEVSTRSFYSPRPGSYNETRGPTGGPEVVETLYNI
jgi:hypothetical protein